MTQNNIDELVGKFVFVIKQYDNDNNGLWGEPVVIYSTKEKAEAEWKRLIKEEKEINDEEINLEDAYGESDEIYSGDEYGKIYRIEIMEIQ